MPQQFTNYLNLNIDEGGDLGDYGKTQSQYFILTITCALNAPRLTRAQQSLEGDLLTLKHSEMLHTAPLVRGTGNYEKLSRKQRRTLLKRYIRFGEDAQVLAHSIILNRESYPTATSLVSKLTSELRKLFDMIELCFSAHAKITINYDDGQPRITKLLQKIVKDHQNFELCQDFDQATNRVFQMADMHTYLDRLQYRIEHEEKLVLTNAEKRFFSISDLRFIQSVVQTNRLEDYLRSISSGN